VMSAKMWPSGLFFGRLKSDDYTSLLLGENLLS
jgi:hypothetical protein